jgi:hypothetical protein
MTAGVDFHNQGLCKSTLAPTACVVARIGVAGAAGGQRARNGRAVSGWGASAVPARESVWAGVSATTVDFLKQSSRNSTLAWSGAR